MLLAWLFGLLLRSLAEPALSHRSCRPITTQSGKSRNDRRCHVRPLSWWEFQNLFNHWECSFAVLASDCECSQLISGVAYRAHWIVLQRGFEPRIIPASPLCPQPHCRQQVACPIPDVGLHVIRRPVERHFQVMLGKKEQLPQRPGHEASVSAQEPTHVLRQCCGWWVGVSFQHVGCGARGASARQVGCRKHPCHGSARSTRSAGTHSLRVVWGEAWVALVMHLCL
jgi:hypothetical protein